MKHLRQPSALAPKSALCIGAFDGLHLGHRALLQLAADRGGQVAVLTFEPHPAVVLAPDRAPPRLTSSAQRVRVARSLGVDTLAEVPFDLQVAALDAETFVRRYLIEGLAPDAVIVGEDFRYGKDAAGTTQLLGELLGAAGIALQVVPQLDDASGHKIGSSEIRRYLKDGDIARANQLLGYSHAVSGPVRHGAKRGRQLGFPTANIESEALAPATGVYLGWMSVHASKADRQEPDRELPAALPAVANIGSNPTFADGASTTTGVEVHAIDAELGEGLYDLEVEFAFVERIRGEMRFEGADALRDAIARDVSQARERLATLDPSSRRPPLVERG